MAARYWVGPGIKADGFDNRDATPGALVAPLSYASTTDNAVYRMTGDMELVVKASAVDWTPTQEKVLALCGNNGAWNTINWYLYVNTNGTLLFARGNVAGVARGFTSSAATGFADGSTGYIKIEYLQNNGGVSECKFYTSPDGVVWTQLGTTQTNASVAAGPANTSGILIGANYQAYHWNGTISRVTVKNAVGGTVVYDADFEAATVGAKTFTESSSNSLTVTMNGTGYWDATAGTKWSTTSGGVGGAAVPTAADDVYLDANFSNCTINAASVCRSINCTGYTGTLAGTHALNIGDGTAGAGNIALKWVAGMTVTHTGLISFVSTNATVQEVDFAGKYTQGGAAFTGATGSWQYTGSHVCGNYLIHTGGTLDINGQTCTWYWISSNTSAARTLKLGAANITHQGNGTSPYIVSTNLTVTANTATITFTGNSNFTLAGAGTNWNGLSMVANGSQDVTWNGVFTGVANFTRSTPVGMDRVCAMGLTGSMAVTGVLTLGGNSAVNRLLVSSGTIGTAATFTAATVACSNVDFRDIVGAGAGSWNLSAITGGSGDCGGNSGITFTTGTTQTHTTSAGGNWSDATKWTSRVPLPQDNVVVDGNTSGTLTVDMPRIGKDITLTGFAGTLALSGTLSTWFAYGSVTLASGMTYTGAGAFYFAGRGTHTITSATKAWPVHLQLVNYGGTYSLSDDITGPVNGYLNPNVSSGTFNSNNFTVTCGYFSHGLGMTVNFGTSTVNLTYSAAVDGNYLWLIGNGSFPCDASTANIVIPTATTAQRNISQGSIYGRRFGSLTYTVADSPGPLYFNGSVWAGTLNVGPARSLITTVGGTLYATTWNVDGEIRANDGLKLRSGPSGRYASVPWSAALAPTTDIEVVIRAKATNWATALRLPMGQSSTSHPTRGFQLLVAANGSLGWLLDDATLNLVSVYSSVTLPSVGIVDGQTIWFKGTWRTSDNRAQFFYALDQPTEPSSWTQLGIDRTLTATAIAPNTQPVIIGSYGTLGYQWEGAIYRAILRTAIGGPAVLDADFTTPTWGSSSFVESAAGATVTLPITAASEDGSVRLITPTAGSFSSVSVASGAVTSTNLVIKDNHAVGGATFTAVDSIDVSGNTGWSFVSGWIPKTIMIM